MPSLVPHSKQTASLVVGGMCAVAAFAVLAGTTGPLNSRPTGDDTTVVGTPSAAPCPAGTRETADACVRVVHKVLPPLRPVAAPTREAAPAAAPARAAAVPVRPAAPTRAAEVPQEAEHQEAEHQEVEHEDSPEPREIEQDD